MKKYKKLHESKEVANIHIAKIKERGGEVKQSVQNGKILLEYSFKNKIETFEKELTPLLKIASKYKSVVDFRRSYPDYGGGINERYIIINKKISDLKSTDYSSNIKPERIIALKDKNNPMPIIKGNKILDGHHRIEIARLKGMDNINVMQITNDENKGFSVLDIWNYANKIYNV